MNKLIIGFILLYLFSSYISSEKIAIIGSGIGGSSCAYYLNDAFKEDLSSHEIYIFEKSDNVGGRIKTIELDEELADSKIEKLYFELGADVWATPNLLIEDLASELGLKMDLIESEDDLDVFVYEGKNKPPYRFELASTYSIENLRTAAVMEKFKVDLLQNYLNFMPRDYGLRKTIKENPYQKNDKKISKFASPYWPSIDSWAQHGHLHNYLSQNLINFLHRHGVSHNFTSNQIAPLNRVIYEQGFNMNAFAGIVSLISNENIRYPSLGLKNFVENLINASSSKLSLQTFVNKIEFLNQTGQSKYLLSFDNVSSQEFDFVIMAAPLEYLNITFLNVTIPEKRNYNKKSTSFVKSIGLNSDYFGFKSQAILTNLISDENDVGFFSITPHHTFRTGEILYKVFSRKALTTEDLKFWFLNASLVAHHEWDYTFPDLDPLNNHQNFQPVEIHANLFNLNSIESVTVAMEASVLSANNIARIIYQRQKISKIQNIELFFPSKRHIHKYMI